MTDVSKLLQDAQTSYAGRKGCKACSLYEEANDDLTAFLDGLEEIYNSDPDALVWNRLFKILQREFGVQWGTYTPLRRHFEKGGRDHD